MRVRGSGNKEIYIKINAKHCGLLFGLDPVLHGCTAGCPWPGYQVTGPSARDLRAAILSQSQSPSGLQLQVWMSNLSIRSTLKNATPVQGSHQETLHEPWSAYLMEKIEQ